MAMKEFRNPQDVHRPVGSYTHQIEIKENERMLILSGQIGMRQNGSIPEDPLEQIEIALDNIFCNLKAANMEVSDLVKLIYYLVGEIDTAKRRELVASKLQGHQPCSTMIYVAGLANPSLRVEIDAWASRAE
jgi:2-iminobutanoate/2-iminopropanoate deaminase